MCKDAIKKYRRDRNRTCNHMLPKHALYQVELLAVDLVIETGYPAWTRTMNVSAKNSSDTISPQGNKIWRIAGSNR